MSRFSPCAFVLMVSALASSAAFAQDDEETDTRPIAAIYDIQLEGFSLPEAKIAALTDRFRDWVTAAMQYRVVPGEATAKALVEVKASSHDPRCDTSCKVKLGNALAANKWIETRVDRIGGKCVVSATVYDVGQEISEVYGETDNPVTCDDGGIRAGLREVAAKLIDPATAAAGVRRDAAGVPRTVVTDTGRVVDLSQIDTGEDIVNVQTGETGIIVIDSIPADAALLVNSQPKGNARKSLELPAGQYVIIATLDDYYHVARTEVTVEANKKKRVTMELAPAFGRLDVACTPPTAEVYVDGRFAGTCPFTNPKLRSGDHTIEVRKAFYESVSRTVKIVDGQTTSARFDLPAIWGKLDVSSSPAGAQVWFDGKQIGVTPLATDMIAAGKYNVRLVMPLFEPVSFDVELGAGRTVRKDVTLVPDFGSVVVNTTPAGATVVVDDDAQRCNATPCTFPNLSTGLHVLTVEKDGYAREVRNVDLRRGASESLSITLREKMGNLTIFSQYTDGTECEGELYIDGKRQNEMTPFIGQVLATAHVVSVRCPGAATATETVVVEYNRKVTRTLTVCRPDCAGKSCGSDGCGGQCGTCTGRYECRSGTCVDSQPPAQPVYQPSPPVTERSGSVGGGTAAPAPSTAPSTSRSSSSSDLQLTWETLGVGYVGSTGGLWHSITILPGEVGFKAFKGLLFSAFLDW